MKKGLTFLLTIAAIAFVASCGTESAKPKPDNIIGTWKSVNHWQKGKWIGGDESGTLMEITRITYDKTDSTQADTTVTMVYPNSDFNVVMEPEVIDPGYANVSIKITDHQIPPFYGFQINIDSTQASLGDNFVKYHGTFAASHPETGGYSIAPTYTFDCNQPIQSASGDLRYILKVKNTDSTWVEFHYNLRLKGIQQAAKQVACH